MTIYLDHNATTLIKPDVKDIMCEVIAEPLNASAIHAVGRIGRKYVEQARAIIAEHVQCPPAQIIFNSGATEGNNTILHHFKNDVVLVSSTDHVSVVDVLPNAHKIPVLSNGLIDKDAFNDMVKSLKPTLVSIMLVNNETGVIQPIEALSHIAKNNGALFHCDATQAIGRINVDMTALGVDFLTFSAHKIGGPQGVGALCIGVCGITPVLLYGGGQEKTARAGTENVAGIAGFGQAMALANMTPLPNFQRDIEHFIIENGGKIYGLDAPRVTNTTLFSFPTLEAEMALIALDLKGICISNGSACSSGTVKPSHVIMAMGCDANEAGRCLRVSTGWSTSASDIERFCGGIADLI